MARAAPRCFFFASHRFFEYSNWRFAFYIADTGFRTLHAAQRSNAQDSLHESDLISGTA
jgi:hypothetical protein